MSTAISSRARVRRGAHHGLHPEPGRNDPGLDAGVGRAGDAGALGAHDARAPALRRRTEREPSFPDPNLGVKYSHFEERAIASDEKCEARAFEERAQRATRMRVR